MLLLLPKRVRVNRLKYVPSNDGLLRTFAKRRLCHTQYRRHRYFPKGHYDLCLRVSYEHTRLRRRVVNGFDNLDANEWPNE